ncbi:MAG: hypothetical protein N3E52_07105, partial [Candidatus Bathyarchaeota archaeon]|nr:hypothetical protein [Candidatus Bathyarchaeota archaeon]
MLALDARKKLVTLSILLLAFSAFLPMVCVDQANAASVIASAKNQVVACYQAAAEAESAGANITALVTILNNASALISRAEYAYSTGDFDAARDFAVQSQSLLSNFVAEANVLKETAVVQRTQDFWINIVGSAVGALAVLGVGSAVWVILRRREESGAAQVNKAKP